MHWRNGRAPKHRYYTLFICWKSAKPHLEAVDAATVAEDLADEEGPIG